MSYGAAAIAFAYLASFMFESTGSLRLNLFAGFFLVSFFLVLLSFLLDVVATFDDDVDETAVTRVRLFFFRNLPPFLLGEGIITLAALPTLNVIDGVQRDPWDYDMLGQLYVQGAVTAIVYLTLVIAIDSNKFTWLISRWRMRAALYVLSPHYALPDLTAEKQYFAELWSGLVDATESIVGGGRGIWHANEEQLLARAGGSVDEGNEDEDEEEDENSRDKLRKQEEVEEEEASTTTTRSGGVEIEMQASTSLHMYSTGTGAKRSVSTRVDFTHLMELDRDANVKAEVKRVAALPESAFSVLLNKVRLVVPDAASSFRVVLRDVCVGVAPGECFAFLGMSNAGKSALLEVIIGKTRPTHGSISLLGKPIVKSSLPTSVGYMPQFDPLLQYLTGRRTLELSALLHGIAQQRVADVVSELLGRLDLSKIADTRISEWGKDDKRVLSLGVAIIGRPPIVVLDEPTQGTNDMTRRRMWNVISGLSADGITVLISTSSLDEVQVLSHRMAVLESGEVRSIGSPSHVMRAASRHYVVELTYNPSMTHVGTLSAFFMSRFQDAILEFQDDLFNTSPSACQRVTGSCRAR